MITGLAFAICVLLVPVNISAQNTTSSRIDLFTPVSPVSSIGNELASFYDEPESIIRAGKVIMNEHIQWPHTLRRDDKLILKLFDDTEFPASLLWTDFNPYGTTTIAVEIEGFNYSYAVISSKSGRTYATIFIGESGQYYKIISDPITLQHYVIEINYEAESDLVDAPPMIPPDLTEEENLERIKFLEKEMSGRSTGPFDPATLDLMFVYTPAARSWADNSGGGLLNRMANKLAWGQIALNNSDVNITLRLVMITETVYAESGSSGTDLTRFTNTNDGFMDEIHAKRNTVGADLCILFTHTGDAGGVAWLLTNINGMPDYGFSVTRITQNPAGFTFIHEIGHNLGGHHHKQQNVQPGPTNWSNWTGNNWSAGWVWTGLGGSHYASVMSYTSASHYNPPLNSNSYTRVPHFSNPSIIYDGVATGHTVDGDNARSIRGTKHAVAAYRSTIVDCRPCPEFDFDIVTTASWQTHSASIQGNYDCKIYRIPVTSGNLYTFKTGCGDGASASFNTFLELYDEDCFMMAYNDDGCAGNASIVYSHFNYTGYAYLKVRSDTTGSGAFTIAYMHEPFFDPCTNITYVGGTGPAFTQTFIGGGAGSWFNSLPNACGISAYGKQQIYAFDPPSNGFYSIEVPNATGEVSYQSNFSCGPNFWFCIGSTGVATSLGPVMFWTGGIINLMLEKTDSNAGSHEFYINLVCGAVSNLSTLPGANSVFVSWTEPNPAPANGYDLTIFDSFYLPVGMVNLPAGNSGYNFTGLNPGSQYNLKIESLCGPGLQIDEWTQFSTTGGYDFGDAPEDIVAYPGMPVIGQFPTCVHNGIFIRHSGNNELFFGPMVDYEGDGNGGNCFPYFPFNADECFADGDAGLITPGAYNVYHYAGNDLILPCPGSSVMALGVTGNAAVWGNQIDIEVTNNLPADAYFSLLIDWNQNGEWNDPAEQVLVNFPIPSGYQGPLSGLVVPDFVIGPQQGYVWARFTLTGVTVPLAWFGQGDFSYGETEDYLLYISPQAGICDPPSGFVVNPGMNDAQFDWVEPVPSPVNGYELVIMEAGSVVYYAAHPAGTTAVTVTGLNAGAAYGAFIRSLCPDMSGWEYLNFSTLSPPCDPPQNLTVSVGVSFADITWNIPPNVPQNGFAIELIDQNGVTVVIDTVSNNSSTYLFAGLVANSTYSAGVKSLCAGGLVAEEWITFVTNPNPLGYDFGDAPDGPYPTLLANNGARHQIVAGMLLGLSVDDEPDGQPDAYALGDDQDGNDDEDGVKFLNSFVPGQSVDIEFTVQGSGYINGWIDWNANGSWADAGEHAIIDFAVNTGVHVYSVTVPPSAATGFTFSRFRFSSQAGLSYHGDAPDGEVEDYRILINSPEGHKMHFPQYPDPAGWDVNITYPAKVGDDWMCSETGYVEDFHFWVSWKNNWMAFNGVTFTIEIYSDMPASASPTGYSKPDSLLWERDFAPGDYNYQLAFEHPQGWYDPTLPFNNIWDHLQCFRVDIDNFSDPFFQEAGTIYWLVITAKIAGLKDLGEESIVLYLDNIPPGIQPYEQWEESEAILSIQDHPEWPPPPAFIVYPEGGIELITASLDVDLSEWVPDEMMVQSIEFDIIELGEPGMTWAMLFDGDELLDMSFSQTHGPQTLMLHYADLLEKSRQTTLTAIRARLSSLTAAVVQVRINVFPLIRNQRIGWKTSLDHFNDIAVWKNPAPGVNWSPSYHPLNTWDSLSMAFVITGSSGIPAEVEIDNATFPDGTDICFEAEQSIFMSNTIVESNAKVLLVAGHSIHIYPDTHIKAGSEFIAAIDTTGAYCNGFITVSHPHSPEPEPLVYDKPQVIEPLFRLYPNPTPGWFTLELRDVDELKTITVQIFNIQGEVLVNSELPMQKQNRFDLSGKPAGIYIVRVMKDMEVGVERLIKH